MIRTWWQLCLVILTSGLVAEALVAGVVALVRARRAPGGDE